VTAPSYPTIFGISAGADLTGNACVFFAVRCAVILLVRCIAKTRS
jgi:hypothetical protein